MKGITKVLLQLALAAVVFAYDTECPPEQEENWEIEKLLRHADCNKFYKCTFGKPVEFKCPEDLFFDLEAWECNWREDVDCTDRNIPPPNPETTRNPNITSTTTTTTKTPKPSTAAKPSTPKPTTPKPTTPKPTTPQPTTPKPTTPKPTTTTTTTTKPKPTPPATTTTQIPEFLPNGCPVDPHIHWLLPHENNCQMFYYCVWGEKVLRECPETTHFNRVIQVCDWPQDAGCIALNKHLANRQALLSMV